MKKILALAFIFALLMPAQASAAITDLSLTNLFPPNSFEEGTNIALRLTSDSTATTTVNTYLYTPNGSVYNINSEQETVSSQNPYVLTTQIDRKYFTDYGLYEIKVNETNNNLNDTIIDEIQPTPAGGLVASDAYYLDIGDNVHGIISLADSSKRPYDAEWIEGVEIGIKSEDNIYNTYNSSYFHIDDDYDHIHFSLPIDDFEVGQYEMLVKYNLSTCDQCPEYQFTDASGFHVLKQVNATLKQELNATFEDYKFDEKVTKTYCVDDNELKTVNDVEVCHGGSCENLSISRTETCEYGCKGDDGVASCRTSPLERLLIVFAFIAISVGFVYYVGTRWL